MSSWEKDNNANSAPKFAADLVKSGSGNAGKKAKTLSLFGNTTPDAFIPGTTKSMIYASDYDIKYGSIPVHSPGWYLKTVGSGGRSNRVQYECITTIQGRSNRIDWFVDQINGNDGNTGKSSSQAFKTLAAVITAVGSTQDQIIGLACGSTWKEEFSIGTAAARINGTKLISYGSGEKPLIDGSEVITSGSFSLASGQTVTYQANVTLQGLTPGAPGGEQRLVWEDGRFLLQATSIANCEATPGSYFYSSYTSTTPVVYVHASDGTNPTSNGKLYEFNCRYICVDLYGDNLKATNIRTRRQRNNNGSLNLNGDTSWFYNCTMEDGHKHCSLTWEGGGYINCSVKNAYNGTSGFPNFIVINKPTGLSKGFVISGCIFTADVNVLPNSSSVVQQGISAVICHCNSGDFGRLFANNNRHNGPIVGYNPQEITSVIVDGDIFTDSIGIGSSADPNVIASIKNVQFTITATYLAASDGHAFACAPTSGRATVSHENCVFNTGTYEPIWVKNNNVDYTFTKCNIVAGNTSARFPHGLIRLTGTGCTLTVNGTTLNVGYINDCFYNLAADTVYAGNNNSFIKTTNAHWQRAASDVATTISGWQTYSGQDANSTLV